MNYKETLYFVAKCLTISLEDKNRQQVGKRLQSETIDWDAVVKVSTAHLVFPALYCNLKRADFLQYLPQELVSYMEHITNLNRRRNEKIIAQVKELNSLLLAHSVTPIFLKGSGNLIAGLYEDIAERMVGDIDFIFSKEDYPNAVIVLKEFGYLENGIYHYKPFSFRHFPRLVHKNKIAAVEIHSQLLIAKYTNEFNYHFVEKDSQIINGIAVLSLANKLNLSIIAHQINDNGIYYKTMALRNAYDVFLLSKKTNVKDAINILPKLMHPLNCFLATCYEVFNKTESLEYYKTKKTAHYLFIFNNQLLFTKKTKRWHNKINTYIFFKSRLLVLYNNLLYKKYLIWSLKRTIDKNWYKEKLFQLRPKK